MTQCISATITNTAFCAVTPPHVPKRKFQDTDSMWKCNAAIFEYCEALHGRQLEANPGVLAPPNTDLVEKI